MKLIIERGCQSIRGEKVKGVGGEKGERGESESCAAGDERSRGEVWRMGSKGEKGKVMGEENRVVVDEGLDEYRESATTGRRLGRIEGGGRARAP